MGWKKKTAIGAGVVGAGLAGAAMLNPRMAGRYAGKVLGSKMGARVGLTAARSNRAVRRAGTAGKNLAQRGLNALNTGTMGRAPKFRAAGAKIAGRGARKRAAGTTGTRAAGTTGTRAAGTTGTRAVFSSYGNSPKLVAAQLLKELLD